MSTASIPGVFVSSTCYDLAQVRTDLSDFIRVLGLTPFLSEHDTFPLDPSLGTAENCTTTVGRSADIFVLVVGGRYGSVPDDSTRSVTNLEYLTARNLGIPIYAFVQRDVLAMLPVWRDNPNADFRSVVDSPRVFEFVDQLKRDVWVSPFSSAQDITAALRNRLAALLKHSLDLRLKLADRKLSPVLLSLQGNALSFAIEQPRQWEVRLLHAVLFEEVERARELRFDLKYGTALHLARQVDAVGFLGTIGGEMARVKRTVGALTRLINVALADARRPDGTPSGTEELVLVARRIGACLREFLEWAQTMQQTEVVDDGADDLECRAVTDALAAQGERLAQQVEDFIDRMGAAVQAALDTPADPNGRTVFNVTLEFESNIEDIMTALRRVWARYGVSPD